MARYVEFCVKSSVVLDLHHHPPPRYLLLFFCPFVFGIVIVRNSEGQPDLGRMANLRLIDKQGKELVKLKQQVLA
jgi:hypothetical protein